MPAKADPASSKASPTLNTPNVNMPNGEVRLFIKGTAVPFQTAAAIRGLEKGISDTFISGIFDKSYVLGCIAPTFKLSQKVSCAAFSASCTGNTVNGTCHVKGSLGSIRPSFKLRPIISYMVSSDILSISNPMRVLTNPRLAFSQLSAIHCGSVSGICDPTNH